MSLSDPIADMLTRIRNALRIRSKHVNIKASKVCEGIAKVLKEEGFIVDYDKIDDGKQGILRLELKYTEEGHPVIFELHRVSRPGCRVYSSVEDLPYVLDGLGIAIVSTSSGVLSDRKCREENVSGELLCMVS